MKYIKLFFFSFILFGCKRDDVEIINPVLDYPNILLIIADDFGKDAAPGFTEGLLKPKTPVLDKIRNQGITFNNLWVNPTCSPTRASIITGKYGYRTGVKWANDELDESEVILQRYIADQTNNRYSTAIIGKWHLSGNNTSVNPENLGLDYYSGLIRGGVQDYYQWQLTEDGVGSLETSYITEKFTNLSIDWINNQSKPWFLWLAYTAPHTPFHTPPEEMHSQGNLAEYVEGLDPIPYYMAAIEAMDYQIGRLLKSIPQDELNNTIIMFIGDNGTPSQVAQSPYSASSVKGSLFQGGINVPMYVCGAGVYRQCEIDNNLICSTDLFSTISEIAGVETSEIHDSKSFRKLFRGESNHRNYQYSEMNDGLEDLWAISDGEFKLIVNANGNELMFDLLSDQYENNNLLNSAISAEIEQRKVDLETELNLIRN